MLFLWVCSRPWHPVQRSPDHSRFLLPSLHPNGNLFSFRGWKRHLGSLDGLLRWSNDLNDDPSLDDLQGGLERYRAKGIAQAPQGRRIVGSDLLICQPPTRVLWKERAASVWWRITWVWQVRPWWRCGWHRRDIETNSDEWRKWIRWRRVQYNYRVWSWNAGKSRCNVKQRN